MSRQCRSKVELIQLGSAHENYGVWTRPQSLLCHAPPKLSKFRSFADYVYEKCQTCEHYRESHTFFIYRPLTTARDKKNVTKDTCVSMFKKQFSIHTGLWSRISGQKHSRNGPELVWINDYVLFFWCTALISDMRFLPVEQACFPCGRITNIPSAKKARQNRWNTASSLVLGKAIICFL